MTVAKRDFDEQIIDFCVSRFADMNEECLLDFDETRFIVLFAIRLSYCSERIRKKVERYENMSSCRANHIRIEVELKCSIQ